MIDARLEAEYNNRRKVPPHPAIVAGWAADAAAFRSTHPHAEIGLAYGAGARERIDLFWPDANRDAPIAVFLHGGYWAALDGSWFSHLAAGFNGRGIALAIPTYDLCPVVTLEAIVEQMREAAGWLIERHRRDLFATGHSAGGHLAAMLLATDWAARGVTAAVVTAALTISGLFDLAPLLATSINGPLGLDAGRAASLSPIALAPPGRRLLAHVGSLEGDAFIGQSRRIAEAWGGRFDLIPGANHFTAIAPLADPGSALIEAILREIHPDRS